MNGKEWRRPRTQRVYLHAPLATRPVILWPDFKVTSIAFADNGKHTRQESAGFILLHGADCEAVDYTRTSFSPVRDGIPVYTLNNDIGVSVSMECFTDFDDNPRVFARVRLKNGNAFAVSDEIAVYTGTGEDRYMTTSTDTGYSVYRPRVGTWYLLNTRFEHDGLRVSDGRNHFLFQPSENLRARWIEHGGVYNKFAPNRYMSFGYALEPGEEATLTIAQRWGEEISGFDYADEREKTVRAWKALHAAVRVVPDTENPKYLDAYYSMVTQCMQMFARYCDGEGARKNWIVPRQGDVGCLVWPWEAAAFMIPLDHIGMRQYTGAAYRYFIEKWFTDAPGTPDDGKIMSDHQQWGNLNGSLLWGISEHLLCTGDRAEFDFFRPYLERILGWINRERARSEEDPGSPYKRIFPAGKGSDWNEIAQHWMFTDGTNVNGLRSLVKLYERFGDKGLADVRRAYEDYRDTLLSIVDELYRGHESDECFVLPHQLGIPFEETETACFSICGMPALYETRLLDPRARMFEQMENYFVKRGFHNRGLTGRMSNVSGGGYELYEEVYYTVNGEKTWLAAWKARGETEKAARTFAALMKYCMTKEYVVSERYCPDSEWFSPWQPNASSSGRMISILLDYFGEKAVGPSPAE